MNAISTRDLTRRYGTRFSHTQLTAVDNLNLKVEAGSLYGLIGPNGAGKTTTLRMLAGLLEPTSGEIRINGLAVRQYWNEIQWQIGFMPDFFGVYEDLLVWEYLDFFARCYKLAPERRKQTVDELLELVDLTEKRDSYVQNLSRGMRQRLCLAHALVHDPQILLLDEPASGLDPRARVEMRELLRELSAMGKTIILSSHILTELAELCTAIGIIEKGHLIISGSMEEIRKRLYSSRKINIHILSDLKRARAILNNYPSITEIHENDQPASNGKEAVVAGHIVQVDFSGDETAAADLLTVLVAQGVSISSFHEATTDLEDLFLQLTDGSLSDQGDAA
jgi:ABC-2 type transport system ATP-binding protein